MDNQIVLRDASYDLDPNSETYKQWKFEDNLNSLIDIFTGNIEHAYSQYQKDNNWMALADSIWESYERIIGFGEKCKDSKEKNIFDQLWMMINAFSGMHKTIDPEDTKNKLVRSFKKNAKNQFIAALDGSFGLFYDVPKEYAIFALTRLLGRINADRDFEALSSSLTEKDRQKCDYLAARIEDAIRDQQNRPNIAEIPVHDEVQEIPLETTPLPEQSDSQKISPNATVVPADKKTDSGQVMPIKWTKTEDQLKHLSTELKSKGLISDVDSFTCQFSVVGTQTEKILNHVPADWIGHQTIFTYLFSLLQKSGIIPQKLPLWSTLEKHFTYEGKSMNNLKQTHNGYKGRKPRGAQMIDEIIIVLLK